MQKMTKVKKDKKAELKKKREEEEKPKGPRQRALLSIAEVQQHLDIKRDIQNQMKFARTRARKEELLAQLRNIESELHEHWQTMPRNPVEDYSAFPRS